MELLTEVRFKYERCAYYTNPNKLPLKKHQYVIVEAEKGADIGKVSALDLHPEKINFRKNESPFPIIRIATEDDIKSLDRVQSMEVDAKEKFLGALTKQKFTMRLVDVEYQFDGNKLTFYFMAETRVDFRDFLKDLARIFRTRIELRQINERQELQRLGGIGPCGRELCCKKLSNCHFRSTMQMVKDQQLAPTSSKITGLCGRLLCCLSFEEEFYLEQQKVFPPIGEEIEFKKKKMHVAKNNFVANTIDFRDENNVLTVLPFEVYIAIKDGLPIPEEFQEKPTTPDLDFSFLEDTEIEKKRKRKKRRRRPQGNRRSEKKTRETVSEDPKKSTSHTEPIRKNVSKKAIDESSPKKNIKKKYRPKTNKNRSNNSGKSLEKTNKKSRIKSTKISGNTSPKNRNKQGKGKGKNGHQSNRPKISHDQKN